MALRWNNKVKNRDNHICQICGELGTDAHHILCAGYFPELYNRLDNGITLCRKCHILAHRGRFGAASKGKYPAEKAAHALTDRAKGNPEKDQLINRLIAADLMATEKRKAQPPASALIL